MASPLSDGGFVGGGGGSTLQTSRLLLNGRLSEQQQLPSVTLP